MPSFPVEKRQFETKRIVDGQTFYSGEFCVVGCDSTNDIDALVVHVALTDKACEINTGASVSVFHMRPPLASSTISGSHPGKHSIEVNVVADILLDQDELFSMINWRENVECIKDDIIAELDLLPFQEYILIPHKLAVLSELNRPSYWRYSCVGLVIDCYEEAGIDLIDLECELPEIEEEALEGCYPDLARIEKTFKKDPTHSYIVKSGYQGLAELGLAEKPWRPILVGYLFHSLSRFSPKNPRPGPYTPKSNMERFFPTP